MKKKSECQTVWIQIRHDIIQVQTVCIGLQQMILADRVLIHVAKIACAIYHDLFYCLFNVCVVLFQNQL